MDGWMDGRGVGGRQGNQSRSVQNQSQIGRYARRLTLVIAETKEEILPRSQENRTSFVYTLLYFEIGVNVCARFLFLKYAAFTRAYSC